MVSFGDPVFFVKKKSQQKSSVLVKKKNIKPKLGNLKPFCIILKTSMFLEFFYENLMFLWENHHFPDTSIFRLVFSISLVLICSTTARGCVKGLQRSLPGIKNPPQWLYGSCQPAFLFVSASQKRSMRCQIFWCELLMAQDHDVKESEL